MIRTRLVETGCAELRDSMVSVYAGAYSGPPYFECPGDIRKFGEDWGERVRRPGFRLAVAEQDGRVVGMAYGWASGPGSGWQETLSKQLGPGNGEWLESCFEFVDIAVLTSHHGLGAGKALYETLFSGLPFRTSLLYTHHSDTAAYRMYLKLGWKVLRSGIVLRSGKEYVLMGKRLSATDG